MAETATPIEAVHTARTERRSSISGPYRAAYDHGHAGRPLTQQLKRLGEDDPNIETQHTRGQADRESAQGERAKQQTVGRRKRAVTRTAGKARSGVRKAARSVGARSSPSTQLLHLAFLMVLLIVLYLALTSVHATSGILGSIDSGVKWFISTSPI